MTTYTPNVPPSKYIKSQHGDGNEMKKPTKQEFRKQKELEEGRKAG